jgi:hypothetical protein
MGIGKWIKSRSRERSTYVGIGSILAGVATVAGRPELADSVNDYLPLVLTVLGGVLVAKPAPEPDQQGILPLRDRR